MALKIIVMFFPNLRSEILTVIWSLANCELVCIGHDLSISNGHKVFQGEHPQNSAFDFWFHSGHRPHRLKNCV
jgi:hypothetical protein